MTAYSEDNLSEKLQRLLPTQQSIQTCKYGNEKSSKARVEEDTLSSYAYRELAPPEKRITLLYLANDVMQTSRSKGIEFLQEFSRILVPIVQKVYSEADNDVQKQIERLLVVWQDRRVLQQSLIDQMRSGFKRALPEVPHSSSSSSNTKAAPQDDFARQFLALAERTRRIDELAEAAKTIKPELRTGEALRDATPETYASTHAATREAMTTLEAYVQALDEDVSARDALLQQLQQFLATQEKLTAERRTQLQQAQAGITPVITSLKNALLQPPPVGLPLLDAPSVPPPTAAGPPPPLLHEAYTPQPSAAASMNGGTTTTTTPLVLTPDILAALSQLAPAAANLLNVATQHPPAAADPKQPSGWFPLQQ